MQHVDHIKSAINQQQYGCCSNLCCIYQPVPPCTIRFGDPLMLSHCHCGISSTERGLLLILQHHAYETKTEQKWALCIVPVPILNKRQICIKYKARNNNNTKIGYTGIENGVQKNSTVNVNGVHIHRLALLSKSKSDGYNKISTGTQCRIYIGLVGCLLVVHIGTYTYK